jgi:hypothetical protein
MEPELLWAGVVWGLLAAPIGPVAALAHWLVYRRRPQDGQGPWVLLLVTLVGAVTTAGWVWALLTFGALWGASEGGHGTPSIGVRLGVLGFSVALGLAIAGMGAAAARWGRARTRRWVAALPGLVLLALPVVAVVPISV